MPVRKLHAAVRWRLDTYHRKVSFSELPMAVRRWRRAHAVVLEATLSRDGAGGRRACRGHLERLAPKPQSAERLRFALKVEASRFQSDFKYSTRSDNSCGSKSRVPETLAGRC